MALFYTSQWSGTYNSHKRTFRGWLEYTTSSTNTTYTITITSYGVEKIESGATTWEQSTGHWTITGALSHTTDRDLKANKITFDSTANSRKAVWTATSSSTCTATFNRTTSTQTKSIVFTAKKDSSYWAGSGTGTLTISIPALPSYTISYVANGGSGSISNQTKYYNTTLTLASSGFTYTNRTLTGWKDQDGNSYNLGASYTGNKALTLTAQWKVNYISPTITNLKAYRTKTASTTAFDPAGTYVFISFDYKGGSTNGGSSYIPPSCEVKLNNTPKTPTNPVPTLSPATGPKTYCYGPYDTSITVTVSIHLYDTNNATGITSTITVPMAQFPIAILNGGKAMGLMHPAISGQALTLTGGTIVDGAFTSKGNATLKGTLAVTGASTLTGKLTANGAIATSSISASSTITSSSTVKGATLESTGTLTVAGNGAIKGDLTLKGHSSAVGSIVSAYNTAAKSLKAYASSDTPNTLNLCSITLTAGTWVITGLISFPKVSSSGTNDFRRASIATSATDSAGTFIQSKALASYATCIEVTKIVSLTSSQTYYLNCISNQTLTIAVGSVGGVNYIQAVRIA